MKYLSHLIASLFFCLFFVILLFPITIFAQDFPNPINNFGNVTLTTPSSGRFKDIFDPTADMHQEVIDRFYNEEIKDIKANIQIEKYRVINSQNINFLFDKHIQTTDLLLDVSYINDIANSNIDIIENNLNIK